MIEITATAARCPHCGAIVNEHYSDGGTYIQTEPTELYYKCSGCGVGVLCQEYLSDSEISAALRGCGKIESTGDELEAEHRQPGRQPCQTQPG